MIKITKDLRNIPTSLIPAFSDLFSGRTMVRLVPIPQQSSTTHARRMDVINAGFYTDTNNFNSRYKLDDIKLALYSIYKRKCAFCEQNEEVPHVEHYRPKVIYYWLAFSWDNLLLSCPTCNISKSIHFDLDGDKVVFDNTTANIRNINTCSADYDNTEIPKMVNPEITDPLGHIYFTMDGKIGSDNARFRYTIEKCKIDRKALNDSRRSILDRFKEHIRDAFIVNKEVADQIVAIRTNIRNFVNDSNNEYEVGGSFPNV